MGVRGRDARRVRTQVPHRAHPQRRRGGRRVDPDDADAAAAKATSLGAEVVAGPFDAPWTRMAVIKDPQGATFIASQFVLENKDLEA